MHESEFCPVNYLNNHFAPVKVVDVLDELPIWSAPFGLKLLDAIGYKSGITVLDIGFGTGFSNDRVGHEAQEHNGISLSIPFVLIDVTKE